MDSAAYEQLLKVMVDWEAEPALDQDTIDALLAFGANADAWGNSPGNVEAATAWSQHTAQVGERIAAGGRYWVCTVPGATGSVEPQWPVLWSGTRPGTTQVADGDATWTDAGTSWWPSYSLDAAAAMGWRIKAGKVATRYGFMTDGQQFSRQQMHAMCLSMAQTYERRCSGTIQVGL
jgi:hypothetical protein